MKYLVFLIAALGTLPLSVLLFLNGRWMKYVFFGIAASICLFQSTSINFFSHEEYRGTALGMEVSLVHMLSLAMLIALLLRGRFKGWEPGEGFRGSFATLFATMLLRRFWGWFPEGGFRLYLFYFLLCLPSLTAASDCLISWFEIWKMMMLYLVYLTTYTYLKSSDDVKTVLRVLGLLAIVNTVLVVLSHLGGVYQPRGFFPHRNGMAMAMQLLGNLFFAGYLMNGIKTLFGQFCLLACGGAVLSTIWSYSRGAIMLLPITYSITALACLLERKGSKLKFKRLLPMLVLGAIVAAIALPRIIERFANAPQKSGDTRVELAYCAREMIKDEPLRGVGINNWSLKMEPPYHYQDRAGALLGLDMDYTGIVETVYLLVGAECGIPALLAMIAWFVWYWFSCIRLLRRLKGTWWYFIPAGLLGGLTAQYLQSTLEWVLRQQRNMILLMMTFAILSYLNTSWRKLADKESA